MEIFTELPTAENCIKSPRNKFKNRESQRDDLTKDRIKSYQNNIKNSSGAKSSILRPNFINYYKEFKLLPNAP